MALAEPVVRPARQRDAGDLASIDASVSNSPWSATRFSAICRDAADSGKHVLVILRRDLLEGFILYTQVLDEASVQNIAVRESCRGEGLGGELLRAALSHMKERGATRCLLEVRESNVPARRLYAANGFEQDGARKDYYPVPGGRENALLMSRKL